MSWLIWKEYRLQRLVVLVGLVLLFAPYLLPPIWQLIDERFPRPWHEAANISLLLSVLTLALLGGNAIASERADRSAEFQSYQPIPRWQILLGKLTLPLVIMLAVWGFNFLVLTSTATRQVDALAAVGMYGIFGLSVFGVAWLMSSLQTSPTFAVAGGLMTPVGLAAAINLLAWLANIRPGRFVVIGLFATVTLVGCLSIVAGSWYYLRRVEP